MPQTSLLNFFNKTPKGQTPKGNTTGDTKSPLRPNNSGDNKNKKDVVETGRFQAGSHTLTNIQGGKIKFSQF